MMLDCWLGFAVLTVRNRGRTIFFPLGLSMAAAIQYSCGAFVSFLIISALFVTDHIKEELHAGVVCRRASNGTMVSKSKFQYDW